MHVFGSADPAPDPQTRRSHGPYPCNVRARAKPHVLLPGRGNDLLSEADFPAGTFSQTKARVFYLGYLTLLGTLDQIDDNGATQAAQILERAQRAGLTTCVDLVSTERPDFEAIISASAPFIDYLILNEVEAARATGTPVPPTDATGMQDIAQRLLAKGVCKAVIIHSATHLLWQGADGTGNDLAVPQLPPVEIASHLGAGDAFCAGMLYALHQGWDAPLALSLAANVARESLRGMTANSAIPPLSELI